MSKFFIKTFGCQMNVYTSDYLRSLLLSSLSETDNPKEADFIFINTCDVREKVRHKIYSFIGYVNKVKKKDAKVYVIGCLAQVDKENIKRRFNPYLVGLYDREEELQDIASSIRENVKRKKLKRISAYLPIIYGCDHFCSYCIVPYARGREKSKPLERVIKEAKFLFDSGTREIILIGQNVNDYGKDLGLKGGFIEVVKRISEVGFIRVGFLTSHPKNFKLEWIDEMKSIPNLLSMFHLPLQSGSNKVLKLMRRGYTREKFRELVEKVRKVFPDAMLSTDIMVGFPGEEEKDFMDTIDLVKDVEFDRAFMFMYSKRPNTSYYNIPDTVSYEEKLERLKFLIEVQDRITLKRYKSFIGKEVEVLVENVKDGKGIGKEKGGRVVIIEDVEKESAGKLMKVKIYDANIRELFGRKL